MRFQKLKENNNNNKKRQVAIIKYWKLRSETFISIYSCYEILFNIDNIAATHFTIKHRR